MVFLRGHFSRAESGLLYSLNHLSVLLLTGRSHSYLWCNLLITLACCKNAHHVSMLSSHLTFIRANSKRTTKCFEPKQRSHEVVSTSGWRQFLVQLNTFFRSPPQNQTHYLYNPSSFPRLPLLFLLWLWILLLRLFLLFFLSPPLLPLLLPLILLPLFLSSSPLSSFFLLLPSPPFLLPLNFSHQCLVYRSIPHTHTHKYPIT